MTSTIAVPEALTTQQSELTSKLAELDQAQVALTTQRSEVETALGRLAQAIAFLRGEVVPLLKPTGARRPMSEQARANIKAGLLKAAAKKREAAQTPSPAPEAVVEPVLATTASEPAKKAASAKKK